MRFSISIFLFSLLFSFLSNYSYCQGVRVIGKTLTTEGKPLISATVTVVNQLNGSTYGALSDHEGTFIVDIGKFNPGDKFSVTGRYVGFVDASISELILDSNTISNVSLYFQEQKESNENYSEEYIDTLINIISTDMYLTIKNNQLFNSMSIFNFGLNGDDSSFGRLISDELSLNFFARPNAPQVIDNSIPEYLFNSISEVKLLEKLKQVGNSSEIDLLIIGALVSTPKGLNLEIALFDVKKSSFIKTIGILLNIAIIENNVSTLTTKTIETFKEELIKKRNIYLPLSINAGTRLFLFPEEFNNIFVDDISLDTTFFTGNLANSPINFHLGFSQTLPIGPFYHNRLRFGIYYDKLTWKRELVNNEEQTKLILLNSQDFLSAQVEYIFNFSIIRRFRYGFGGSINRLIEANILDVVLERPSGISEFPNINITNNRKSILYSLNMTFEYALSYFYVISLKPTILFAENNGSNSNNVYFNNELLYSDNQTSPRLFFNFNFAFNFLTTEKEIKIKKKRN